MTTLGGVLRFLAGWAGTFALFVAPVVYFTDSIVLAGLAGWIGASLGIGAGLCWRASAAARAQERGKAWGR